MKVFPFSLLASTSLLVGIGTLLLCCQSPTAATENSAPGAVPSPEPSVLATTRHYVRLLTQATPPPRDSLLRYQQVPFESSILPGHYLLRLRTYAVEVQPDANSPIVTIEPLERALPVAATLPATRKVGQAPPGTVRVDLTPRRSNPVLAVQLPLLTAAFGPWKGDFYIPVEEPLEPEMHPTELHYRNSATRHGCRVTVYLKNTPSAAANAVHKITLWRDDQP